MADQEGGRKQQLGHGHGSSIYSLTLEEVQSHLGTPLYGMNLDELLKHVSMADAGTSAGMTKPPCALSRKTVVEVWRDVQLGNEETGGMDVAMLGGMSLETFLQKAAEAQWLQYHQQQQTIMEAYVDMSSTAQPSDVRRRKRVVSEDMAEIVVERRQKRMIKNRESAARSRARRQAYTNELEHKIIRLEEENQKLRKQKELESIVRYVPQPDPKHQLRRTSSATF
ncbi:ABSCISIC ACID-INSENSITIVE 5-like protein 2 [Canna indica]|uniref:ABSCISIC ACID-INSENSITIVE 5-like protein 2 n=1 Tax=Canna indica TaxID=4628 RepID=A0AAQ3QCK1_9LILI|nr:ABSCISIC ACID-INSENSITIVE 5-like protein 2 [Canna indica]